MSPVHVRAEPGDFAESVLLPGDPRRARYIAENFFEEARLVSDERGLLGYTGTYEGERISVQTTGMGCPSAAIVTEELIQLGAKNLLRVGTCGGYLPEMELGDPEEAPQKLWHSLGVLAVEMEASAIFTLSAMHGVRAGCLLTVSNLIGFGEGAYIEEGNLKGAVDDMMGLALETLTALN